MHASKDKLGRELHDSGARGCSRGAESGEAHPPVHYKHVGLYVYRREFLLRYPELPVGPLEKAERLEQLRALEAGHKIRVVETEYASLGVDTPEDLVRVNKLYEASLAGVIQNG